LKNAVKTITKEDIAKEIKRQKPEIKNERIEVAMSPTLRLND